MTTEILFRLVIDDLHKSLYVEHERGGEHVLLAQVALAATRGGGSESWQGLVGAALDAIAAEMM